MKQTLTQLQFVLALTLFSSIGLAETYPPTQDHVYNQHGMAIMKSCETGENLPLGQRPTFYCGHNYVVKYFDLTNPSDVSERDTHRVSIIDGLVYQSQDPHTLYPDGDQFFVMDPNGNFFLFSKAGETPLHHSSFFAGQPIVSGGEMTIKNGKIIEITPHTGHYKMNTEILRNAAEALHDRGVILNSN